MEVKQKECIYCEFYKSKYDIDQNKIADRKCLKGFQNRMLQWWENNSFKNEDNAKPVNCKKFRNSLRFQSEKLTKINTEFIIIE